MLFRMKDAYNRAQLSAALRPVLDAPPIRLSEDSHFGLLSQIREKDVLMYLTAVKSFCRWHQPAHVTLLIDGDFCESSLDALHAQVPGISIEAHTQYRRDDCPVGGTWERLAALVAHASERFTVQLDADTITLGRLKVVEDCIAAGRAFTLGSGQGQRFEPAADAAARADGYLAKGDTHIQTLSESKLAGLRAGGKLRYVRGCSGFTGIAPGAVPSGRLLGWARQFRKIVGERWNEWGTEQFMSNVLIANAGNSVVLPHPEYATCPSIHEGQTVFAHMAGFCRFANNHQYARLARATIATL